jgi:hypothetical protein
LERIVQAAASHSHFFEHLSFLAKMIITDEEAAQLKTWVVKKLEDM